MLCSRCIVGVTFLVLKFVLHSMALSAEEIFDLRSLNLYFKGLFELTSGKEFRSQCIRAALARHEALCGACGKLADGCNRLICPSV